MVAVLTNIDRDHLINYEGSFARLKRAFIEFAHNLPFYGLLVACIDDPGVRSVLPEIKRSVITYGFDDGADVQAYDEEQVGACSRFSVRRKLAGKGGKADATADRDLRLSLNLPGRHNICNALAAVAAATDEGISDAAIVKGLAGFRGVGRRFEMHGRFSTGSAMAPPMTPQTAPPPNGPPPTGPPPNGPPNSSERQPKHARGCFARRRLPAL